jgi:hypothetical protein
MSRMAGIATTTTAGRQAGLDHDPSTKLWTITIDDVWGRKASDWGNGSTIGSYVPSRWSEVEWSGAK